MIQDFIDSGDNLKTKEYRYKIGEEINIGNFHAIITETSRKQGRKSYKYECLKCGYEGEKLESLIYKGFVCPCCANRIIIPGVFVKDAANKFGLNPGTIRKKILE